MTRGISFKFNHRSDLDLAQAMIDDVAREQVAAGHIEVRNAATVIGNVGKLSAETVRTIPKGSVLSLIGDFNPNEQLALSKVVLDINASIDPQGRNEPVFSLVR